jgi:2-polyprenyl-6-methoxyphenol hydroxylase-like FAD-dependent oxidoreductase
MSAESASAVVVVGAGPTGLVASSALRAAGVDVRTLDAAPAPATTSRALGLQPRGIEVLDRIGAIGDLREGAVPLSRSIFRINGRHSAELSWVNRSRSGPANPLIISQADIEASLRNRLTEVGGTVEWNQRVVSVEDTGGGASVRLADGTVVHADWVIGADGAHSVVRKAAGIDFPGVPRVERLLIADVCADLDCPRDAVVFFAGPTGLLGAFPLPGDNVWRLMAPATGADQGDPAPADIVDELEAGLAQHAGGVVRSVAWASSFRIHRRLADAYRRGRLLLAGDAAHIHSPVGAQGLNTGIGDAENLAWKLALVVNGAHEELLDSYEAERRPIAAEVLSNTGDVTEILGGTARMTRLIRDHVMLPMLSRRWVQRRISDKASQLSVTYRKGPLGSTGRRGFGVRAPGLRPGDRVPDAEFICENGDVVRLFTLLGPGWALLGRDSLGAVAKTRLGDVAVLPGEDDALLVRPDGHLAWRGRDPRKLANWLDTALGRPSAVDAVSAR